MHQKGMETAALYHRLRSALDSSEIDPCIIYEEALLGGWRDLSELALRRLSVDMIKMTAEYHRNRDSRVEASIASSSVEEIDRTPSSNSTPPSATPRRRPLSKFSSSSSLSSAAPPEWAALLQQASSKFSSTTLNSASTDSQRYRWSKQSTVSSPSTPTSRSRSDSASPRRVNAEFPWPKSPTALPKSNALALHPNRRSKVIDADLLELDDIGMDGDGLYDFLSFPPPISPPRTNRRLPATKRASIITAPQLPPSPPHRTIPLRPVSSSPTRSPANGANLTPTKATARSISPMPSIAERPVPRPARSPPKIPLSIIIPDTQPIPAERSRKSTQSPTPSSTSSQKKKLKPPMLVPFAPGVTASSMPSGGDIGFFSLMRGLTRG